MEPLITLLDFSYDPLLPHAVKNISKDTNAILYEMADGEMKDKEAVDVI